MMLLGLIKAAALGAAAATAPLYLQLDGVYYAIPPGGVIEYVPGAWVVSQTSMTNCNRRNNQVQQYSNFSLLYGPNLDIVYLSETGGSSYSCSGSAADEACMLAMVSATGDILCGGVATAPDPNFANGFDGP